MREFPKVLVLGEGILGLTCALALRVGGCSVSIVGRHGLMEADVLDKALIASAFPAASVLVHSVGSVQVSGEEAMLSEKIFRHFEYLAGSPLVRTQMHYELFDWDEPLGNSISFGGEIVHSEAFLPDERSLLAKAFALKLKRVWGWRSKMLFVEYPKYVRALGGTARRLGIGSTRCEIDRNFLRRQNVDVFVNCLGPGASSLLNDDEFANVLLGGLLFHDLGNSARIYRGDLPLFSYNTNFVNGPFAHRNPDGSVTDLYCYPRTDCMILGGTRQRVPKEDRRNFIEAVTGGRDISAENICLSCYEEAFLELHRRVLERAYGMRLSDDLRCVIGFRPARMKGLESVEGPRVTQVDFEDVPVVHCYGFGGAGFTLSWWAAARVRELVFKVVGRQEQCVQGGNSSLAAIDLGIRSLRRG